MANFNFKNLVHAFGKFVYSCQEEFRRFYWTLPIHKDSVHNLTIFKNTTIKYRHDGDIALIIFVLEPMLKFKKSFEYSSFELMTKLINKNDVVLDIGANTGLYSIFLSKLIGENGKIYAFEPGVKTLEILKLNLSLNQIKNTECFNFAVSNEDGEVLLLDHVQENNSFEGDSFKYISKIETKVSQIENNTIRAVTIDSFVTDHSIQKLNFIKIDVEGAEKLVLEGAVDTLRNLRPTIIFESNNAWSERFNYKPYEIIVLLHSLNYSITEYEYDQWVAIPK